MMMSPAFIAAGVALLALVAGTFLLNSACCQEVCCKGFSRVVGWFTIVLSLIILGFTAYHVVGSCHHCGSRMGPGMWGHGGGMMEPMAPEEMQKMAPQEKGHEAK